MKTRVALLSLLLSSFALAQSASGLPGLPGRANAPIGGYVTATTATGTFFVDPTGNDSNPCTASGTSACATLSGAFAKLPNSVRHAQTFNVAAGSYTDLPSLNGYEILATITVTGPALTNVTPTTGTATGTLTAVSNVAPAVFTDSTQTWTVNDFIGRLFTVAGVSRVIASNTATTLTLASVLAVTPSVGAAYSIQRQAATITPSTTGAVFSVRASGTPGTSLASVGIGVSGIDFENAGGSGYGCEIILSGQILTLTNVRCKGATYGLYFRGGGQITTAGLAAVGVTNGLFMSTSSSVGMSIGSLNLSNGFFYGSGGNGLSAAGTGVLNMVGSAGWTAQTNAASDSAGALGAGTQMIRTISATGVAVFKCLQAGPAGALQVGPSAPATTVPSTFTMDYVYIDNCTTGFDLSQGMGNAWMNVVTSLTCNNTTTCIKVGAGSRFRVPATWTLTGVTNDIDIDGTMYTKANLTAATPTRLPTAATLLVTPTLTGSSVWQ